MLDCVSLLTQAASLGYLCEYCMCNLQMMSLSLPSVHKRHTAMHSLCQQASSMQLVGHSMLLCIGWTSTSPDPYRTISVFIDGVNPAQLLQTLERLKGTNKEPAEETGDTQTKQLALRRQAYHLLQRAALNPGRCTFIKSKRIHLHFIVVAFVTCGCITLRLYG